MQEKNPAAGANPRRSPPSPRTATPHGPPPHQHVPVQPPAGCASFRSSPSGAAPDPPSRDAPASPSPPPIGHGTPPRSGGCRSPTAFASAPPRSRPGLQVAGRPPCAGPRAALRRAPPPPSGTPSSGQPQNAGPPLLGSPPPQPPPARGSASPSNTLQPSI